MNMRNRSAHEPLAEPIVALVDAMVDSHIDWREAAATVAEAYRRWCEAPRADEAELYSAYLAGLDQEHSAAIAYELSVRHVERWLERAEGRFGLAATAPASVASRRRIEIDPWGRPGGRLDANRD